MTTPFGAALRKKFPGPKRRRQVATLLGIDADLINGAVSEPAGGNGVKLKVFRTELEKLVGSWLESNKISDEQIEQLYELLDQHSPPEARDQGEEDDREARLAKLRAFLGRKGFGEDDIRRACDAVVKGRDYAAGKPENVFQGGLRGGQIAGDADIARLVDRITIEPNFDDRRTRQVAVGMDSAAVDELNKMFPGIELIQTW